MTRAALACLFVALAAACPGLPGGPAPGLDQDMFVMFEARSRGDDVLQRTPVCVGVDDFGGGSFQSANVAGVVADVRVTDAPSAAVAVVGPDGDARTESWDAADFEARTVKRVSIPLGDGTVYTLTGMGRLDVGCSF